MAPQPDFGGYVTKYGVKCSDGRTILAHAFKGNDGQTIPLVWQHQHDSAENVLGHLVLQHRDDGVYSEGFFNATPQGQHAKELVNHKDIKALSIYANQLAEKGKVVTHGNIKEGSLVLAGANPGAFIDNVYVQHGDNAPSIADGEVIIYSGQDLDLDLQHAGSTTVAQPKQVKPTPNNPDPDGDGDNDLFDPADGGLGPDASMGDVFNTMTPEQKNCVYSLVGNALQQSGSDDTDDTDTNPVVHDDQQKGTDQVSRNVFDKTSNSDDKSTKIGGTLSHDDVKSIFASAKKNGSLKEAVEEYAMAHGIDDISTLFPYDQAVTDSPDFITRRMEWVAGVLGGVHKTPFSRIRSWTADLTQDEARAKGYIKTSMKKEQFFAVAKRITTPQTIYKKQKLDRDDMLDITEFDVVAWLNTELRLMLDEELARAILWGDGREVDDPDKISATNIRPILTDDDMYVTTAYVDLTDASSTADEIVDTVIASMQFYRGSGNPDMYMPRPYLAKIMTAKDTLGRRLYSNYAEVASAMGIRNIIPVEDSQAASGCIGIIINLNDYTVGADKGGEVSMFDFFDIDFNQFKYLLETRCSGAMTKYKGALVIQEFTGVGGMLADPTDPTFVSGTGVVTIPTVTHVSYVTVADDGTESGALSAGAQTALSPGGTVHVRAKAASTYSFANNAEEDWFFTRISD